MATGIHDPFAPPEPRKPKEKKISKYEIGQDTHDGRKVVPPSVELDGRSYVLVFHGVDNLPDAANKLMSLMYEVAKKHKVYLAMLGIHVGLRVVKDDERALTIGSKQLTVYAPEDCHHEEAIYRRVAHALLGMQVKDILKQFDARVFERGIR
jgi:hypothetical protein